MALHHAAENWRTTETHTSQIGHQPEELHLFSFVEVAGLRCGVYHRLVDVLRIFPC